MKENLKLYERVRKVPEEAKKPFNNGSFSGTDINPMWRIKMLTEHFGACGEGWYYDICEHWKEEIGNEILTHVRINLYVKFEGSTEWSAPISGLGGNKALKQFSTKTTISDEGYKSALTDAISVACKALGIGADVYWENDTTSKYAEYYEAELKITKQIAIKLIKVVESNDELKDVWSLIKKSYGTDKDILELIKSSEYNDSAKKKNGKSN